MEELETQGGLDEISDDRRSGRARRAIPRYACCPPRSAWIPSTVSVANRSTAAGTGVDSLDLAHRGVKPYLLN
jgi:hypothetical protein